MLLKPKDVVLADSVDLWKWLICLNDAIFHLERARGKKKTMKVPLPYSEINIKVTNCIPRIQSKTLNILLIQIAHETKKKVTAQIIDCE